MTKEEMNIQELVGRRNPFRVPEGYFEEFNERLMNRLPQSEQKGKIVRLLPRLWHYAAAIVVVVGLASVVLWNNRPSVTTTLAEHKNAAVEPYYDDELDYIMVGNTEIAVYLTEAE